MTTATGKAIPSTLTLYRRARSRKVAVFFVTGRPPQIAGITALNLVNEGYDQGWNAIRSFLDAMPSPTRSRRRSSKSSCSGIFTGQAAVHAPQSEDAWGNAGARSSPTSSGTSTAAIGPE